MSYAGTIYGYQVVERLSGGLVVMKHHRYARALWGVGKLRKRCQCATCDITLLPGVKAFRPLGNGLNRADRLCEACVGR